MCRVRTTMPDHYRRIRMDARRTAHESIVKKGRFRRELRSIALRMILRSRRESMRGPAGYLAIIGMMRGGFPDIQWTLEEMVAEGDKVAARFTMRGTHLGTFFGVPPTGKTIAV